MASPFIRAAAVCATLMFCAAANEVHWYLASGNTEGNAAFLKEHGSAISGAYLCCNFATFEPNGTFSSHDVSQQLQQMAVITSTKRDAWIVVSVSQEAVYSGSWTKGLDAAAATARQMLASDALLRGWIVDYEPSTNYSMAHAQAYGAFLGGLAKALRQVGLALAMDIAGWGILGVNYWPAFVDRGLARFTSMTPTYDGTNITADESFVSQALLNLPSDTYAAGLSSQTTGTEGSCSEGSSHWTQENMPAFVEWMVTQGVNWVDVWRSDIDCPYDKNGAADATEPWFMDAITSFLASGS